MNSGPCISVIIPTLEREKELCDTLRYFLEKETYGPFEVIVVDQSDLHTAETRAFLESARDRITHARINFRSQPGAINLGVRLAAGEIIVIVDDDVEPQPGFLAAHADGYKISGVTAVTGPVLRQKAPLRSRMDIGEERYSKLIEGKIMMFNVDFGFTAQWAPCCNVSFNKVFFDAIGGYDENFYGCGVPIGHDAEIHGRVKRAGGRLYSTPGACVIHKHVASGGCRTVTDPGQRLKCLLFNRLYFYRTLNTRGRGWVIAVWRLARLEVLTRKALREGKLPVLCFYFVIALAQACARLSRIPQR
ncbi:MAG: glycosyltransferase [Candidatus Omnitrophota bacterium]